jgi:DoxX-like family
MASECGVAATAPVGKREPGKRGLILYWVFTLLLIVQLMVSGTALILGPPMIATLIRHLGYPEYFAVFLGIAKLLAIVAIAQSWSPTLKEWGYAGATFDLLAADISHIASHDSAKDIAGPFVIMVLLALSYFAYAKVKRRT